VSPKSYQQVILPEHESIRLRLYRDLDRLRLLEKAALIGPATREVMESILADNVIYGIRPAYGVLTLGRKYSGLRLEAACRRALMYEMPRYRNVKAILDDQNLTFANVVKSTVFLTNLADFAGMNEVYAKYFTGDFPARSTIQVAALPKGASVEIEVVAHF